MSFTKENFKQYLSIIFVITLMIFLWQLIYPANLKKNTHHVQENTKNNIKQEKILAEEQRIFLENQDIKIGFNLKGLKIDFAELKEYNNSTNEDSGKVKLLNSAYDTNSSYLEFGWLPNDETDLNLILPTSKTEWKLQEKTNDSITFSYMKNDDLLFINKFTIGENFLLTNEQTVINKSDKDIDLTAYGRIQKNHDMNIPNYFISHEGFVGTPSWNFTEKSYKKIQKKGNIVLDHSQKKNTPNMHAWLGITEKYWMQAIILPKKENFQVIVKAPQEKKKSNIQKFYIDFTQEVFLEANSNKTTEYQIFVGPKQIYNFTNLKKEQKFFMFDRAIDLGIFHIITKPIFFFLQYINKFSYNFGIAIIILTTVIKLLMFPIAYKAHRSTKIMQSLQPKLSQIREKFADSPIEAQKESMTLFKKHNINPFAGLLPILIQIPIFFSLYKVLFITIEMRHAPFFGWIKDLSAPDSLYVTNLFGIIPFSPPSFLAIGIFPVLLCITAIIQQKITPTPMMNNNKNAILLGKAMPYIFLFIFSSFPVGLVLYWLWNNILMIIQQLIFNRMKI